jgi:hypothetical protein
VATRADRHHRNFVGRRIEVGCYKEGVLRALPLAVASLALVGACRASGDAGDAPATGATSSTSSTSSAPTAGPAPSVRPSARGGAGGVTIEGDGKGGYRVRGGTKMKGDARTCAAYKACCSARDLSLFCGMLEATEKDCSSALQKVRSYASEAKIRPPAGCE